jgi:hypothetical protein
MMIRALLTVLGALALDASLLAAAARAAWSPRKAGLSGCNNEVLGCRKVRACVEMPGRNTAAVSGLVARRS